MAYNKVKKAFDADLEEFTKDIVPEELKELANKQDKIDKGMVHFIEMNNKVNSEYNEFVI